MGSVAVLVFFVSGCGGEGPARKTVKTGETAWKGGPPPVILVSIDTLRADRLPAYGYGPGETPVLDAFAREAVLFENTYCHTPLTLPSHASLLTGLLPTVHGVRDNLGYQLDPEAHPLLPDLLRPAGYESAAAVSAYVLRGETGLEAAFDHYDDAIETRAHLTLDRLERSGEETLRRALAWLDERPSRGAPAGPAPPFLFVHLFEPHDPYEPPDPYRGRFPHPYDGEVAYVDSLLGTFFEGLKSRGLWDDALVIVTSDHGEGLGDHGEAKHGVLVYRSTLHVPLLVKLPGGERGGTRVAAPAQLVDVAPTVLAAAGVAVPRDLPGRSLLKPVQDLTPRRIYSESYYGRLHYGWSELRSLVDDRFHYIDSPNPELFDVVSDPGELVNVLTENRRVYASMRDDLEAFPVELDGPAAVDPEVAARLTALGYVTAPVSASDGPRPDPKENLHLLDAIQEAVDLQAAGRLEEAAAALQELQRTNPEIQDVYLLLGPVLRRLGRLEEAVAVGLEGQRRLPVLAPLISLELARTHLAAGDLEEAQAAAEAGAAAGRAQSLELQARIAQAGGDLAAAERQARAALTAADPPRATAQLLLARLLLAREQTAEAVELFQAAAAQVREGRSAPLLGLDSDRGDALARLGRIQEAEAAFRAETERFPGNLQAYERLAVLLATERRFAEIEPLFETMVEKRPVPEAYELAARVLERLGNAEAAGRWRARAASSR